MTRSRRWRFVTETSSCQRRLKSLKSPTHFIDRTVGCKRQLQTSGGLCYFLHDYLDHPVPSPALLKPRHDRLIAAVQHFAGTQGLEVVPFERGESKDVRVAKDRARFTAPEGVVFIGVAQEKMRSFKGYRRQGQGRTPVFDFSRQSVAVNHYYFYVRDQHWVRHFSRSARTCPIP